MNTLYGTVITGMVTDENNDFYFIQKDGVTFAMDKQEDESLSIGDTVKGFVYESSQHKKRLTTNIPKVQQGKYAWATVTQVRKDLGVFVDIGLPDKEIVVSLDDLPQMKELWPKKNDRLMISLRVDKKERLWGILADEHIFRSVAKKGKETDKNKDITATAFRLKLVGTYVLTDDYYIGFIHPSERVDEPRLGEQLSGRVIGVRPDGILNLSLRRRAHEAIGDDAEMLLAFLNKSKDGSLPFWDKSDPDDIKQYFGISKGQFKRAVGNLLKRRMIEQKDGYIRLVK
ncbi:DNA-binding protein [Carnobacteriaceae bacterium zg-84]|uniref:CvfB family protein n=1 Tax=Granulicatella sp. zg-84 TaxID=2678503 RepID=UPI0013C24A3F|nr:S1-like domain-containing RNA-binding protein [Granulicatella sp. zg-84]NEW65497.1 DNA-binding protein [Granulicatella sp. zg-84]QMI85287.1 DNA-binding protein [Carnobacteriaceae bacterium zg-84]